MASTWFITGTSKGFGREWAEAALERGDRVAATARDVDALAPLVQRYGDAVLPLRLDVTDRSAASCMRRSSVVWMVRPPERSSCLRSSAVRPSDRSSIRRLMT